MQNHHHETVSTSPKFFARQFFLAVGPISATVRLQSQTVPLQCSIQYIQYEGSIQTQTSIRTGYC